MNLAEYLLQECEDLNLSMREASIKSGLSEDTIGVIVRQPLRRPRPETLRKIADALGADFNYMMILAGHLPETANPKIPAEHQTQIDRILSTWKEVAEIDPHSLARLLGVVQSQAEMLRAALKSYERARTQERK